jgi:hypothetical protein
MVVFPEMKSVVMQQQLFLVLTYRFQMISASVGKASNDFNRHWINDELAASVANINASPNPVRKDRLKKAHDH